VLLDSIPGAQQLASLVGLGGDAAVADRPATPAPLPATPGAPGAPGDATLRKIAAQYDVASISPREFSELIDRLHTSGALTDADFQDLFSIRLELDRQGVPSDESLDLVELLRTRLKTLSSEAATNPAGDGQHVDQATRQLEWAQKLALIRQGGASSFDVFA
jgi:hypothetical protein